jgi:hypothetical protein
VCDRTGAGCHRGGGKAGVTWRAVSGAGTRAAGAARRCDRGWMGAEGSWGSKRPGTCRAGGGDMDQGSAGSAGCRDTGDGAGSFGSWDRRGREGSLDRAGTRGGWGIGTGYSKEKGGAVDSRKTELGGRRTAVVLPLCPRKGDVEHTSNQNFHHPLFASVWYNPNLSTWTTTTPSSSSSTVYATPQPVSRQVLLTFVATDSPISTLA